MNGLTLDRIADFGAWRSLAQSARLVLRKGRRRESTPIAFPVAADPPSAPEALGRTVRREVIPRLLVAHRHRAEPTATEAEQAIAGREAVLELAALVVTDDLGAARSWIERRRAEGLSLDAVYRLLLIPAAHRLSDLWESDLCSYEEIAIGMLHLQQLLRRFSGDFDQEGAAAPNGARALLVSAPAERDMLGVFMVSEFYRCVAAEYFHHSGWDVCRVPVASRAQLMSLLRTQWFDLVDVSASCEARLPMLCTDVSDIRRSSRNSQVGVMVGGPVFCEHPEYVLRVGADGCASDPREMLAEAERLVSLRER
jgi:hypothetical protein